MVFIELTLAIDGKKILIRTDMITAIRDCGAWADNHYEPKTHIIADQDEWYVEESYTRVKSLLLRAENLP